MISTQMIDSSMNSFFRQGNQQTNLCQKARGDNHKWPHHFASTGMLIPWQNRKLRLMPLWGMASCYTHWNERNQGILMNGIQNTGVQRKVKWQNQQWLQNKTSGSHMWVGGCSFGCKAEGSLISSRCWWDSSYATPKYGTLAFQQTAGAGRSCSPSS